MKHLLILFVVFSSSLVGQSVDDFVFGQSLVIAPVKQSTFDKFGDDIRGSSNEAEMLLSGAFYLYKEFLSSQDGQHCGFHPSCSVYAIQATKQKGLVLGGIMAFDRLTRCNGLSNHKYEFDRKTLRLKDAVQ